MNKVNKEKVFAKMVNSYKMMRKDLITLLRPLKYWFAYKNAMKQGPCIQIESITETVLFLKNGYSLSRFGDGEFRLLTNSGDAIGFQDHDSKLAKRLFEVLNTPKKNHIVSLPGPFTRSLFEMTSDARSFWIGSMATSGAIWKNFLKSEIWASKTVRNTQVTRPYMDYPKNKKNRETARFVFEAFKELWDSKTVLLVEGEGTNFGLNNDLLDNAKEIHKILVPAQNAFGVYQEILNITSDVINQLKHDELIVLLAIGPTATVLAYDLAEMGVQTLDIGHLDVEYEWFRNGVRKKIALKDRVVNEAGTNIQDISVQNIGEEKIDIIKVVK